MERNNKSKNSKFRLWTQAAAFAFSNGYIKGWQKGRIYTGGNKKFCLPGLNCYSCPGAFAACPIGSLQAVLDSGKFRFSLYVFSIIGVLGIVFGRLICGWVCPFGLIQDLLHKIPLFSKKKNLPGHKVLKYLKYAMLGIFVILLPMVIRNAAGTGQPWFCEYICPSGTLLGGIPLVSLNENLRKAIGPRFIWKCTLLAAILILSIRYYRPFCKYLCPLGALYGFANPISSYRLRVNKDSCVSCGACQKACGMDIKVWENPNSMECIRCGKCQSTCPKGAITTTWGDWKRGITQPDPATLRPVIDPSPESAANPGSDPAASKLPILKAFGIILCAAAAFFFCKEGITMFLAFFDGDIDGFLMFAAVLPYLVIIPLTVILMVLGIKLIKAKDETSIELARQFAKITTIFVPASILISMLVCLYMNTPGSREEFMKIVNEYPAPACIIIFLLAFFSWMLCKKRKSDISA